MVSPPPSKKRKRSQEPEATKVNEDATPKNLAQRAPELTETETPKVLSSVEKSNVQKKIFHAIKEAGRAFKKARDFEIRKIIKRMKAAKYAWTNDRTENRNAGEITKVERLEKELQIAKALDVHPYSHSYVYKKLLTDKLFVENPDLLISYEPPVMESSADEAVIKNIVGRLASTAVVKSAMTMLINAIHRAAGMEVPYERAPSKNKPSKTSTKAKYNISQASRIIEPTPQQTRRSESPDGGQDIDPIALLNLIEHGNKNPEPSDDETISDNEHLSPQRHPSKPQKQVRLPALSTGYILPSDSDSDPDQEYRTFAPLKKERKNRRGQRERQAIWLKKYGSAARHLNPGLKQERMAKIKEKAERKAQKSGGGETKETIVDPVPVVPKKVNDPHPSWVAKQKLREQQQAVMNSVRATKIVFE